MNSAISTARLVACPSVHSRHMDNSATGPELSVVIPTLNERGNILALVDRLHVALEGIDWEVIFVDDNSTDRTMEVVRKLGRSDRRIRGMRRVGRRGLAGACIEGILSSSAPVVAVMDADLQHDETRLAEMFAVMSIKAADLVVGSRYVMANDASKGLSKTRHAGSRLAVRMAQLLLRIHLTDPMSGFFMIRRELVEAAAPRLSNQGFKILLDIVASSEAPLKIAEVDYSFNPRQYGESKLDSSVVMEYLGLLVGKATRDIVSPRLLGFGLVGSLGIVIHLFVLRIAMLLGVNFSWAQTGAMLFTMTVNYALNNAVTYRDRRRRGWRFATGLGIFGLLCSVGVIAGVGVSSMFYESEPRWWAAGIAGAMIGAAWNYMTNSAITWRSR